MNSIKEVMEAFNVYSIASVTDVFSSTDLAVFVKDGQAIVIRAVRGKLLLNWPQPGYKCQASMPEEEMLDATEAACRLNELLGDD